MPFDSLHRPISQNTRGPRLGLVEGGRGSGESGEGLALSIVICEFIQSLGAERPKTLLSHSPRQGGGRGSLACHPPSFSLSTRTGRPIGMQAHAL